MFKFVCHCSYARLLAVVVVAVVTIAEVVEIVVAIVAVIVVVASVVPGDGIVFVQCMPSVFAQSQMLLRANGCSPTSWRRGDDSFICEKDASLCPIFHTHESS